MENSSAFQNRPCSIALIGNFLPRRCGIATFTTDLLHALQSEASDSNCFAVVMNDVPEGYPYPPQVRFELNYKTLSDYRLASEFLNMSQVDVVCVQFEYGIFGGSHGGHIVEMLRNLRMPVITTLHTVLKKPEPGQRAVLERIAQYSDRLIVMSHKAEEILQEIYKLPKEKIVMIHHGIPDVPFVDPNYYKDKFGVEGKKVLLTFGLISPSKGIEYMIDALPAVVKKYPETMYIILGATHPHVKGEQGESYRHSLQRRARDRGVESHIIFHNRFVELEELCEFLGVADVYITPYLNEEQIVSGTLAYALGAGKATVSTPYWYAAELLSDGKGRIVPFRNSEALAEQVLDLFDNEVERHAVRKRAYNFCRGMIWKEVARRYLEVFSEVSDERKKHPTPVFHIGMIGKADLELPQIRLDHIFRLTDDVGIFQHAKYIVPVRNHGYCTDDNARALIAMVIAQDVVIAQDPTAEDVKMVDYMCRYLSFLQHAFNEETGRFRNFMGYDRQWLEEAGSEDCHGHALWGLGIVVGLSKSRNITEVALNLFKQAIPAMLELNSPRAWALGLVGIHAYLRRFGGDSEVRRIREELACRLFERRLANTSGEWPWIEDTVTYANARIPQALMLSGRWLHRSEMIEAGLGLLEWLLKEQTDPSGHFVPIGNHGWFTRDGLKARFDQQPIEALTMIEACIEAYNITKDEKWAAAARHSFEWFLGVNDLYVPLYDHTTGGCCDGLTADGANRNQGAESTLAWVLSLLNMHSMQNTDAAQWAAAEETSGESAVKE